MKKILILIVSFGVLLLTSCSHETSALCVNFERELFTSEFIVKIDTEVGKIPGNDYLNRDDYDYDFTIYNYELVHNFRDDDPVGNIVTNGSVKDNKFSGIYQCDLQLLNVPNDKSYLPEIGEVYYVLGKQNENDVYVFTHLFLKLPNYDINKTFEEQEDATKSLIEEHINGYK